MMDVEALLRAIRRVVREEMGASTRPEAVNFEEAARLLSISSKSIGRMVKSAQLLTVEYGGVRRIPMAEIDRLTTPAKARANGASPERTRYDPVAASKKLAELRKKR